MATIAALATGLIAMPIYAADTHESHHAVTDVKKSYAAKGEIVSIDTATSQVKLRHEAIADLGWPAMTMNFAVADKDLLKGLKSGDKVNFEIAKDPSTSQYVIQTLQVVQ